jgi:hypothetical protein
MPFKYTCLSCMQSYEVAWKALKLPAKCTKCGKDEAWPEDEAKKKMSALVPVSTAVTPTVPTKPSGIDTLSNEITSYIFSMLDENALGLLSMVCKRYRALAKPLLAQFVEGASGFGSGTVVLKSKIQDYLKGAKTLDMAVDQFPMPKNEKGSILGYILANNIRLNLSLGTDSPALRKRLEKAHQSADLISSFHKMHNKIWVIDKEGVIVGSPNVSFSGLEGGNIESCIYIKSKKLGALYGKYLQLLKERTPSTSLAWKEVQSALTVYNSQSKRVQAAFAPVVDIPDFIVHQLADATKIIIRQFLISPKKDESDPGTDILSVLCDMAENKVEIEIYIDEEAYERMGFVRSAARKLTAAGCKVYTQKPVTVVSTGGEKIQHDKLILAELRSGVCRTLIGSAGFTTDVIANNNAENFLSVDIKSVYEDLMKHHLKTLNVSYATTTKR